MWTPCLTHSSNCQHSLLLQLEIKVLGFRHVTIVWRLMHMHTDAHAHNPRPLLPPAPSWENLAELRVPFGHMNLILLPSYSSTRELYH